MEGIEEMRCQGIPEDKIGVARVCGAILEEGNDPGKVYCVY